VGVRTIFSRWSPRHASYLLEAGAPSEYAMPAQKTGAHPRRGVVAS